MISSPQASLLSHTCSIVVDEGKRNLLMAPYKHVQLVVE